MPRFPDRIFFPFPKNRPRRSFTRLTLSDLVVYWVSVYIVNE